MLVLSRYRDQSVIINGNIVVTIVDIRGDKVRLGIEAPKETPVHRREVYDAIQREGVDRKAPATDWLAKEAMAMNLALRLLRVGLARIEVSPHVTGVSEFCFRGMRYSIGDKGDAWSKIIGCIGWATADAALKKGGQR